MEQYSEKPEQTRPESARRPDTRRERIISSDYSRVIREPHGVSGAAVAAIVISAMACAILITLLVLNNQQQQRDADADRQRAEQAESTPQQPAAQPPIVVVPGSQPAPAAPPAPTPAPPAENGKPSNVALEASVTARLLEDPMLGTYPVDVKTDNGLVTLTGDVPTQMLKQRAARVARSVNGVTNVVNNINVKQ